jgi:hypothetical protein
VTIVALKPNQPQATSHKPQATTYIPQPTTHKQMQSLSECTKLLTVHDILRLLDLENNHEIIEEEEDDDAYPFDYFLQSIAWLPYN